MGKEKAREMQVKKAVEEAKREEQFRPKDESVQAAEPQTPIPGIDEAQWPCTVDPTSDKALTMVDERHVS